MRKRFPSRKECVRWPGNDEASEEWAHAAQGAMGNYEHAAPEPPSCARPLQVECAADGRGRKGQCQGRRGREGQCRKGQRQSTRALRCRPNTKARNRPKPRAPPLRERCDGARRHRRVRVASRRPCGCASRLGEKKAATPRRAVHAPRIARRQPARRGAGRCKRPGARGGPAAVVPRSWRLSQPQDWRVTPPSLTDAEILEESASPVG